VISPQKALDIINGRFGSHPGYRALHAKGILAKGTFTASPAAARLTRAQHMQGEPVPVTVRFSNGSGDPNLPDYGAEVRGMAAKFYLPDGSRTDISAQTVPRFPARTPDAFMNLMRAARPGPSRLWRLPLFLATHPEVLPALRANASALKPPTSYATVKYNAVHAFKWVDAEGGERYVRYHWLPESEEPRLSGEEAKSRGRDYLQEEFTERLDRGPVRFTLQVQLADDGDPTDDLSAIWPDDRETVNVGTLELTGLDTERETGGDVVVFDPTRMTDGIELSDDPVLNFRRPSYSVSVERRSGIPPSQRAP
jgi:catalase